LVRLEHICTRGKSGRLESYWCSGASYCLPVNANKNTLWMGRAALMAEMYQNPGLRRMAQQLFARPQAMPDAFGLPPVQTGRPTAHKQLYREKGFAPPPLRQSGCCFPALNRWGTSPGPSRGCGPGWEAEGFPFCPTSSARRPQPCSGPSVKATGQPCQLRPGLGTYGISQNKALPSGNGLHEGSFSLLET
jgi:hypothetical protein